MIAGAAGIVLLVACAPRPVERPREGAPPIALSTPVRLENAVPPTLIPPGSLVQAPTATSEPAPSPAASPPALAASPAPPPPSPGAPPIIAGLQPAPGAALPPGSVTIGARVTAVNDLVEVVAFVDGEPVPIEVGGGDVRAKNVSLVRSFTEGTHEVRIQARDESGQLGGYRWQFSIGATKPQGTPPVTAPATAPTARPATAPTRTPLVVPTRRPTPPPAAKPAAPKPTANPAR